MAEEAQAIRPAIRAFYAHRGRGNDDVIQRDTEELALLLAPQGQQVIWTVGRDFHRQHYAGDWDSWADLVTATRADGTPRHHVVVVPDITVGRVTARIVETALLRATPVRYYDREHRQLTAVVSVSAVDAHNWRTGWRLALIGGH